MKFNNKKKNEALCVGTKVRVKSLEWYNKNKDFDGDVNIDNYVFTERMLKYCGQDAVVRDIKDIRPNVEDKRMFALNISDINYFLIEFVDLL